MFGTNNDPEIFQTEKKRINLFRNNEEAEWYWIPLSETEIRSQ